MKKVSTMAVLLVGICGAACGTAVEQDPAAAPQRTVAALTGERLTLEGLAIEELGGTTSVTARIGGESACLELDAAAHRLVLRMEHRVLDLREDGVMVAHKSNDDTRGEAIETLKRGGAAVTMDTLRARISAGRVGAAATTRYAATVPIADALAREVPEQAWAAELIARFSDAAIVDRPVAGNVTPKRAPGPGDCVGSCSVRCPGGSSASATCTQGWFSCNTASCSCGSGGASAECDW